MSDQRAVPVTIPRSEVRVGDVLPHPAGGDHTDTGTILSPPATPSGRWLVYADWASNEEEWELPESVVVYRNAAGESIGLDSAGRLRSWVLK